MIPWAIDDLIISDDALWKSVLKDSHGLPQVSAQLAGRLGRWPVFSGLTRPGRRLNLVTLWNHSTSALRAAAKRQFEQYASPEREVIRRLSVVDSVVPGAAPSSVLLALGPWDVARSGISYAPRDLTDDANLATVSGGVIWQPGRFGKAVQIAEATTNMVLNPSAETTGNYAVLGSSTITRDTGIFFIGANSYKIVTTAASGDGITLTLSALSNAAHNVSLFSTSNLATLQASLDGTNWNNLAASASYVSGWYAYTVNIIAAQANGSTALRIRQSDATARTVYIDAVQVEAKSYATPYCDGSLGAGHTWSGTAHASTSARTVSLLRYSGITAPDSLTVSVWVNFSSVGSSYILNRQVNATNRVSVLTDANGKIYMLVRVGGTVYSSIDTVAIVPGAWYHVVAVYTSVASGNATTALYVNGVLRDSDTHASAALDLSGTDYQVGEYGGTALLNGLLGNLCILGRAMTASEVTVLYTAQLAADMKPRWCNVIAEEVKAFAVGGEETDQGVVSTLAVDGDVRWRSRDGMAFWRVIAATGSMVVNNDGDDDTYPIFYITPKTAKTGDTWAYKRWIAVKWLASAAATSYPVDICNDGFDTATLTTAKMQADGDDLRVKVDGVEVNRWLDGMDTATTKVWCNLDFQASQVATMAVIGDTTGTTLTATTDITNWPSTGILYIDTEAITYTGKSSADKTFTGCTRGAKGTTAATHAAAATAYWIQHDIWIMYGNAGAAAPTVDDNYKPAFELDHSTNTSWVYEAFGEDDGLRTASWVFETTGYTAFGSRYNGNQGAAADPWVEIGVLITKPAWGLWGSPGGRWSIYNPCGITNANFTNGEYKLPNATETVYTKLAIQSMIGSSAWSNESTETITDDGSWQAWSQNEALATGADRVGLFVQHDSNTGSEELFYVEAADCTLTLNSSYTPVIVIGAEQSNYDLAMTLTNSTTGDSIAIALTMQLNQTLEIDTDAKTITLLADNSKQMQALTLTGGARRDWLRLAAGNNTLTWSDTGTVSVEVEILFDRRYYE